MACLGTATLSNGLVQGLGDHDITAVFVAEAAGDGAFLGDLLAGASVRHPSLLWPALGLAGRWAPLTAVLLLGACASLAATGAAAGAMARALAPDRPGLWLLAAAAVGPAQDALGGAPTIDPLLLPRGVALPLILGGLTALADDRPGWGFALAGLALPIHGPSAVAGLVAVGAGWWASGRGHRLAPLTALPGIALAALLLGRAGLAPVRLPPDVWALARLRLGHHLDPTAWPAASWGLGLLWLGAALLGASRLRDRGGTALLGATLGLAAWAVTAGGLGPALRLRILLDLEPWQAHRLIVLIAVLTLTVAGGRARPALAAALLGLALLASPRPWRVGPVERDVRALAAWAAAETPEGSLFVLPPDLPGAFRTPGRRPSWGTWKDGGEVPFSPELASTWALRMEALCGCRIDRTARGPDEARRLGALFDARPLDERIAVAQEAGANYLVVRSVGDDLAAHRFGGARRDPGRARPRPRAAGSVS